MTTATISLIVTVALAFVGYLAAYANNLALARRRERLELVSKRLNDFYGPLYLASESSHIAYQAFRAKVGRLPRTTDKPSPGVNGETAPMREWRLWVTQVLMPLNIEQERIILGGAHLIREQEVPVCLLNFVAHVAAWRAVLKKWEDGDLSDNFSIVRYPEALHEYAATGYRELKAEQLKLIGQR